MLEIKNSDTETNLLMLFSILAAGFGRKGLYRRILSCCVVLIFEIDIVFVVFCQKMYFAVFIRSIEGTL